MTFCRIDFINYRKMNKSFNIFIVNDVIIKIIEMNTVVLKIALFDDIAHIISFNNVFYAFDLNCDLIFNVQFINDEIRLIFENDDCFIYNCRFDNVVFYVTKIKTQYFLNFVRTKIQYIIVMIVFYFNVKINDEILYL